MSFILKITGTSAYKNKHGNATVGLYGSITDAAGSIVEPRVALHHSLNGGAKAITVRQLTQLGMTREGGLAVLNGKDAPVRPVADATEGQDKWELDLPPGVDADVEALLFT